ncbi:MAG: DMT family transporter [Chloroflexota bacterium]
MPFGLLTGLGAALSWGTMDVLSALAGRRVGSLLVTAGVVVAGALLLLVLALVGGMSIELAPRTVAVAAVLGVISAGAYFAYFTGLRVGPISVVSGMVAAYGGLTVVLSVAFRGETLTLTQAFGAAIATVGVILTGIAFEGGLRGTRFAGPGVVFAVVALVLFAMMAITTDVALESAGWLEVLLVSRIVTAGVSLLVVAGVALANRRRVVVAAPRGPGPGMTGNVAPSAPERRPGTALASRGRILGAIAVAGALDVLGLVSFSIGLERAPTWLVGLASSFGPAVTILVAVALLGERLKPIQWAGLGGVAIGMIAIAFP